MTFDTLFLHMQEITENRKVTRDLNLKFYIQVGGIFYEKVEIAKIEFISKNETITLVIK